MSKVSFNRLANVHNRFQGDFKKVLCVCSAGMLRSPTLAWVLSNEPFNFNTRAVGANPEYALIPIDEAHVEWADVIIVMNEDQADVVNRLLTNVRKDTAVHVTNIPDRFEFRDPELVEIIRNKMFELFDTENENSEE